MGDPETQNEPGEAAGVNLGLLLAILQQLTSQVQSAQKAQVAGWIPLPMLKWSEKNPKRNYEQWRAMMDSYFVINKIPDDKKWHHVVATAGVRSVELMGAWNMSDHEKKQVDNVFNKFQLHMRGTVNKWCPDSSSLP